MTTSARPTARLSPTPTMEMSTVTAHVIIMYVLVTVDDEVQQISDQIYHSANKALIHSVLRGNLKAAQQTNKCCM